MSNDPTIPLGKDEELRAQELSLQRGHPPAQVPGYEMERLLGTGAFGEVWVAVERNTARRVAIKFYAHRGGLDWSLLSREVEKLAFLFADRYVVQLIGVGWDANPPYYVMEYLERGSLAERLQQGPLPVAEAVEIFHDVAIGLAHAHGKGVLHCDLKPANVLLDQDHKPRLADFGQSRLSHEQSPALGTLFYMAPEQADLEAVPDARWDVYALGALLYCMLAGNPPHRDPTLVDQLEQQGDLHQRLAAYRRLIRRAPAPEEHRAVRGVDRALAEIVDGCLAPDPEKRYPNVQAVLDALHARTMRRAWRPMMVLGAVGPVLLLAVVSLFAWGGFEEIIRRADAALTDRALESNRFAAQFVARAVANELDSRWRTIEQLAAAPRLREQLRQLTGDPSIARLLDRLSDANLERQQRQSLEDEFRELDRRRTFQQEFDKLIGGRLRPQVQSWFVNDARGVQVARIAENPAVSTIGRNYRWRMFFNGQPQDMPPTWVPGPKDHISETTLSHVYFNESTNSWMVAVSTPIVDDDAAGTFRGIVGLTIEVGRFAELQGGERQFAVLADLREGSNQGVVLQHPLMNRLRNEQGIVPARFRDYRLTAAELPNTLARQRNYVDPLGADPAGGDYRKQWLAEMEPISVRGRDTGWIVVVQEAYDMAIGSTVLGLRIGVVRYGLVAMIAIALVIAVLWGFAWRMLGESLPRPRQGTAVPAAPAKNHSANSAATEHFQPLP